MSTTRLATFWSAIALSAASAAEPAPRLITAQTLADPAKLAALERPGKLLFQDDFEADDALKKYFEVRGMREGHARITDQTAHAGKRSLALTAPARDGGESGAGATAWLGDEGHDRAHLRVLIRFAGDYDQGNLNHTGGSLAAVAGGNRWAGMGGAGQRPLGDDRFNSRFETWRDWGRSPAPGYLFLYTYWMEMKRDRDGNYWGNMLGPEPERRFVPERGRWYCLEHMIRANDPDDANGELAAWIDGKLYIHYTGIRWRSSPAVRIKRLDLGIYIHSATRDNTVWFDDVAASTGYLGPPLE